MFLECMVLVWFGDGIMFVEWWSCDMVQCWSCTIFVLRISTKSLVVDSWYSAFK